MNTIKAARQLMPIMSLYKGYFMKGEPGPMAP